MELGALVQSQLEESYAIWGRRYDRVVQLRDVSRAWLDTFPDALASASSERERGLLLKAHRGIVGRLNALPSVEPRHFENVECLGPSGQPPAGERRCANCHDLYCPLHSFDPQIHHYNEGEQTWLCRGCFDSLSARKMQRARARLARARGLIE